MIIIHAECKSQRGLYKKLLWCLIVSTSGKIEIVIIPAAAEKESAKATKIQRFQECCGKREIPGEDRSNTLARARPGEDRANTKQKRSGRTLKRKLTVKWQNTTETEQ